MPQSKLSSWTTRQKLSWSKCIMIRWLRVASWMMGFLRFLVVRRSIALSWKSRSSRVLLVISLSANFSSAAATIVDYQYREEHLSITENDFLSGINWNEALDLSVSAYKDSEREDEASTVEQPHTYPIRSLCSTDTHVRKRKIASSSSSPELKTSLAPTKGRKSRKSEKWTLRNSFNLIPGRKDRRQFEKAVRREYPLLNHLICSRLELTMAYKQASLHHQSCYRIEKGKGVGFLSWLHIQKCLSPMLFDSSFVTNLAFFQVCSSIWLFNTFSNTLACWWEDR